MKAISSKGYSCTAHTHTHTFPNCFPINTTIALHLFHFAVERLLIFKGELVEQMDVNSKFPDL